MSTPLPPAGSSPVTPPPDLPAAPPERTPPRADGGWRKYRVWIVIAASAVAGALIGGGLAYLGRPSAAARDWYAAGRSAELAAVKQDTGLLTGPVSVLTQSCTATMNAAPAGQRPASTDNAAVGQWLRGCEAAYHQDHPGQLIKNGVMYGNGTKPCTGSCPAPGGAPARSAGAVTVTGVFGSAPRVTIPVAAAPASLSVKTLIEGTGATATSAEGIIGNYVSYDWSGTTSRLLGSSFAQGRPSLFAGKLLPGLAAALRGQQAGSRVLAVIPPADGFGSAGNAQEGIKSGDTLVFVVDIDSTFDTASVPGTQASDGGGALPAVTPPAPGSASGPTVVIPSGAAPPATLQARALIKGAGAVVAKGDDIAVQYSGYIWRTGTSFGSSWAGHAPVTVAIGEGQLIKGWDEGLVGQTVGSRLLLVVPPADAYGSAGSARAGIKGGDTLVFVVDILAAS